MFSSQKFYKYLILAFLLIPSVAFAQAAAGTQPGFSEVLARMLPMFALVFMIYYFMIVKPQQLKIKAQAQLTSSLKKGDPIVTSGGIFAKVVGVESDGAQIEIAPNVKIKIELSHIARVIEPNAQSK